MAKAGASEKSFKPVMTVRGPISSEELGVTLVHEHMAFAYPGWYADESVAPYDREAVVAKCLNVIEDLKALGVRTVIDATQADVGGRDPILLRDLSLRSDINIIAVTGLFTENLGATSYYKINAAVAGRNLEEDFYELFMKEITVGIGKSGVKAGLLKVATGDPEISDYEKTVIKAAVRAAKETGVPIITHTDGGTVGLRQQELFLSLRANSRKIMIGHQNNTADNDYHLAQLQNPHFYIGFDRMSVTPPTGVSPAAAEESLIALLKRGYADRIMLSHDYVANWLGRPMTPPASVGWADWYPTYIFKKLIPKMKAAGVTDDQIHTMLVKNPRRFFDGE